MDECMDALRRVDEKAERALQEDGYLRSLLEKQHRLLVGMKERVNSHRGQIEDLQAKVNSLLP